MIIEYAISAPIVLNLLNMLWKSNEMLNKPPSFSLYQLVNKINNTRSLILDPLYSITNVFVQPH